MGRYQYELSRCIENNDYNIPNVSGSTFVNACYNCNYNTISLKDVSNTGSDWRTATGFIHWGLRLDGRILKPLELSQVYNTCFGKDRLIVNNFPTDRIVLVGVYGFQFTTFCYASNDCCSRLMPVAQRQMFILPSGQGACFSMYCAIKNLGHDPNGCYVYPGWNSTCCAEAFPYFLSVESYPLPVLNSNVFIGENGYNSWVKPTAICSTGFANSDSHTIPIYCNNKYIACSLSSFVLPYSACFSPAIKGAAAASWSLGGKLSADSNSSARDAYVLVSSCGSWSGECGIPDNLAMVIANNSFPTGSCRWSPQTQTSAWNKFSYALGMIECCVRYSSDGRSWPSFGPPTAIQASLSDCYYVPNINEDTLIQFNVLTAGAKWVTHMTDCTPASYGYMCAYSTAYFADGCHLVCNPLGYWTLKWNNGNSYYAVNTHCT